MAGYSGTPLAKKLGFKPGLRVCPRNAPANYDALITPREPGVTISNRLAKNIDIFHFFVMRRRDLEKTLPTLMARINRDGAIWVSWPKKASGAATDISENTIRTVALPLGLVDIKVCAVDATWSGLKLVIRKVLR